MKKVLLILFFAHICSALSMDQTVVPFQQNNPIDTVPDDVFFNHVVLKNLCNIDDPMKSLSTINALCQTNKRFNKLLEKNKNSLIVSFYNPLLMQCKKYPNKRSLECMGCNRQKLIPYPISNKGVDPTNYNPLLMECEKDPNKRSLECMGCNRRKLIPYLISNKGVDPTKTYNADKSFLESCLHDVFESEDVTKQIDSSWAFKKSIKSLPFQTNNQELNRIFKIFLKNKSEKIDIFLDLKEISYIFLEKGCDPTLSTEQDESIFRYVFKNFILSQSFGLVYLFSIYSNKKDISREINKIFYDISQFKEYQNRAFDMHAIFPMLSDENKIDPSYIDVTVVKKLRFSNNYCHLLTPRQHPKFIPWLRANPLLKWTSMLAFSGLLLGGAFKLWQRWK